MAKKLCRVTSNIVHITHKDWNCMHLSVSNKVLVRSSDTLKPCPTQTLSPQWFWWGLHQQFLLNCWIIYYLNNLFIDWPGVQLAGTELSSRGFFFILHTTICPSLFMLMNECNTVNASEERLCESACSILYITSSVSTIYDSRPWVWPAIQNR